MAAEVPGDAVDSEVDMAFGFDRALDVGLSQSLEKVRLGLGFGRRLFFEGAAEEHTHYKIVVVVEGVVGHEAP